MVERSPFGIRLERLLVRRRPTPQTHLDQMVAVLARDAGVAVAELDAVIEGAEPSQELLRQLGPALGIHTADMFVIAGLAVPLDLASAWKTSPWHVGSLLPYALNLEPQQRSQLDELVRSFPHRTPTAPGPTDDYPEGPGALMLRLLKNRNMRPYSARILYAVGGGPYVSESTVAMLGPAKVVMTAQYVTAFAHLLGYTPTDMVALAGVGPAVEDLQVHPASREIAALAWAARHLSSDEIAQVMQAARDMRRESG
jgi:hypothetical protein